MNADRQIRTTRLLSLIFCVAGVLAVAAGWLAAAKQSAAFGQLPYLLSGGAAGIALLTFGIGLLVIAQMRAERRRIVAVLDVMGAAVATRAREALAKIAEERGGLAAEGQGLPVRGARILALASAVIGFTMIALGWNGMSNANTVDQQLPYLLSGGFGGMALILFSVGLLVVAQIRTERRRLMDLLEVMAVTIRTAGSGGPALVDAGDGSSKVSSNPSPNGTRADEDDETPHRAAV